MKILSVDIGGTGIKALRDDEELEKRTRVTTGPDFTPQKMLAWIWGFGINQRYTSFL